MAGLSVARYLDVNVAGVSGSLHGADVGQPAGRGRLGNVDLDGRGTGSAFRDGG